MQRLVKYAWILGGVLAVAGTIAVFRWAILEVNTYNAHKTYLEQEEIASEKEAYDDSLRRKQAILDREAYLDSLSGFEKLSNGIDINCLILAQTPYGQGSGAYEIKEWERYLSNELASESSFDIKRIPFIGSNILWACIYQAGYDAYEKEDFIFVDYRGVLTDIDDATTTSIFTEYFINEHVKLNPNVSVVFILDQSNSEVIWSAIESIEESYSISTIDATDLTEEQLGIIIDEYLRSGKASKISGETKVNDLSMLESFQPKLEPSDYDEIEIYGEYYRSRSPYGYIEYRVSSEFILFSLVEWEEGCSVNVVIDGELWKTFETYNENRIIRTIHIPLLKGEHKIRIEASDKDDNNGTFWIYGLSGSV